jgi:hypothetical protein
MMAEANFFAVFVGIESPDPTTLVAMKKKQNTRRNIAESIHKIYGAGMFVTAGFIVGFEQRSLSAWSVCFMPCPIRSSHAGLPAKVGCIPIMTTGRRSAAINARMA